MAATLGGKPRAGERTPDTRMPKPVPESGFAEEEKQISYCGETKESVYPIYGYLGRVFQNLCTLLTTHVPPYQVKFIFGRKGGGNKGLFSVAENTDDSFCVKMSTMPFFFIFAGIRSFEGVSV